MTNKELKIQAGNTVMESDYSISAKKQLLNFIINEASDEQLKVLILDSNIERLEEDSIEIVNKRFYNLIELENKSFKLVCDEKLINLFDINYLSF